MEGRPIRRFLGAVVLVTVLLALLDRQLCPAVAAAEILPEDELAFFRETIEQMDQSADGKIDRTELELLVSELELEMSDEELQEIMDAIAPVSSGEGAPTEELTPFAKTAAQYQEHAESGCISAPCANHAICQSRKRRGENGAVVHGEALYACVCTNGWAGEHCEQDVDECASQPCANGALCLESSTDEDLIPNDEPLVPAGLFRCICYTYWGGLHCAEDTRDCLSAPCHNGGGCEPRPAGDHGRRSLADPSFQCNCAAGFVGVFCELDVSECASGPCLHDGVCVEPIPGHYECRCRRGYTGDNCEEDTHSPCDSTPCDNGASCTETMIGAGAHTLTSYKCRCQAGYAGMLCNFDLNECASEPCENGGTCTEPAGGEYMCGCTKGWGGENCATAAPEAHDDERVGGTVLPGAPAPKAVGHEVSGDAALATETVTATVGNEDRRLHSHGLHQSTQAADAVSDDDNDTENGGTAAAATTTEIAQQDLVSVDVASMAELIAIRGRLGTSLSTVLRGRPLTLLPLGALEGVSPDDLSTALALLTAPCKLLLGHISTTAAVAPNGAIQPATGRTTTSELTTSPSGENPANPVANKQTSGDGTLQTWATNEHNGVGGGELKGDAEEVMLSNIDELHQQLTENARAAAAARLAALAAEKQWQDESRLTQDLPKGAEVPLDEVPFASNIRMGVRAAENEVQPEIELAGASQPPPSTSGSAISPPSPTPQIIEDDEGEIENDEEDGVRWEPALTALLEQHRLMRLAPGLRAMGVEEMLDLEDVTDAELEVLGAKLVQIRRFRKAVGQTRGQRADSSNAGSQKHEL